MDCQRRLFGERRTPIFGLGVACAVSFLMAVSPVVYERRRPTETVLYSLVREHLEMFFAHARETSPPFACFSNPTLESSLVFLRRTPWARAKVEQLYIELRSNE